MKHLPVAVISLLLATEAFGQSTFSKVFTPNTIGPGSISTITFTITNGDPAGVTELEFTDVLPTVPGDMDIATPANASTTCLNGVVTAPDGGGTISFSDGSLGALNSCTVTVNVTASTPGVHTNPAVTLTYDELDGDPPSSLPVDLTVDSSLPGFSKSFAPGSVSLGSRSTLTFTIDNSLNASSVGSLDFTDNLPAGMEVASPNNASTDCVSASSPDTTITADPGSGNLTMDANGSNLFAGFEVLPTGSTCTVTVDVVATGAGELDNVSGDLLADFVSAGKAGATLEVTVTNLAIQKSFTDDPAPPGGTVTLDFVIDNFDRSFSATGVAFTDDLTTLVPALPGLTFDSLLSNDCGGSVAGVGSTSITFTGGTIAPESFCVIRASLAVPAATTPGIYTNTTGAVTATVDGSPVIGNMASDDLFAEPAPLLTKEFLEVGTLAPDPVVDPGLMSEDVVLRFTVTNTSTTLAATDVAFLDELTDGGGGFPPDLTSGFLPFPVSVTLPPVPDPPCGAGSSLALVSVGQDRQGLELTGGNLAAAGMPGDSCTFDVTVTIPAGFPPGVYTNTTEEPIATVDDTTYAGKPASDTLTVIGAPTLAKTFTDDPVGPGTSVTLEFTLTYSADASGDASGISFTDNLAALAPALAGLTATGLPIAQACDPDGAGGDPGTGTLSGSAGDTLLTFMGGTLSPGESCTFSVSLDVPGGAAPGSYTNTSSGVAATVAGLPVTSPTASDVLKVTGLVFTKEFVDDTLIAGDTTTLRFTIDNIHPTDDATITFFTDNLAAELAGLAATGAPSVDTCGGTLSGTTFLTYVGGSLLSGMDCTIEVEVLVPPGSADGDYLNVTSSLAANQGGAVTVDPAIDLLTVNSNLLQLTKTFTDDPVSPGDSVTLEFTLTNLDAAQAASGIDFTDDLGAALTGLIFDSLLLNDCGAVVAGTGTDTITVTGASLAAAGSCTIRVSLSFPGVTPGGIYSNTTSALTGTIGGFAVTGDPASDELHVIQLLEFSKSFDGPTTATGAAVLTFTITNPGSDTATGLGFTDDLDAVISGLIATSLPAVPCGAGSSITGISSLTFSGGELPPKGGTCSFEVDVMVPASATAGTFPNTTSILFQSGLTVSEPATADLIIEPPPAFAKNFIPDAILAGGDSTLRFTIDNGASALAGSSLAFTDSLPIGVVVATPSVVSNGCGGTLTATAGADSISLSGGSVVAGASCTVDVDVTSAVAGVHVNTTGDLTSSSGNSGTASDTLTVGSAADLSVTKTDGVISAVPGGSLTYTIVASNAGPSDDPSVLLVDAFPAVLTCTWTSVAAGGASGNTAAGSGDLAETLSMPGGSSVSYTIDCDIDPDATGTLSNTATVTASVTDNTGGNNSATDADTVLNPEADLSVTKDDGVTSADPGGSLTYTIVASNAGPSDDPSVSLTDTLPAELTCTWSSVAAGGATGNTAAGSGDLAETLSMPDGSSVSYTVDCDIDPGATGTLSNTAIVTASITDPAPGNNSATDADTELTLQADIGVTKTDGVTSAVAGGSLTYTIVASNAGPSEDPSVSLADTLPAELTCTWTSVAAGGASGNAAAGSGDLAETLSMPDGGSVTYTVNCDIDPNATGTLSNTATVSASITDPVPGNNSATDADTELTLQADIGVTKTDGVTSAVPGESLIYTIVASNAGPGNDPSVTLTDALPADLSCTWTSVAAGGATGNMATGLGDLAETLSMPPASSVTYTVNCDIDPSATGTLSNTATVTASVTDNTGGNNSATDDDTVLTPEADLSLTKSSDLDTVFSGSNLTYILVVTNEGPSDSSGGTVTDLLPSGLSFVSSASGCTEAAGSVTCPVGPLTVGSTQELTFVTLVSVNTTGELENTATVSGNETDPNADNDSAVAATTVWAAMVPVPTLSGWMLLLLMVLFAGMGMRLLRRES